jgi:hypothetical protein
MMEGETEPPRHEDTKKNKCKFHHQGTKTQRKTSANFTTKAPKHKEGEN